MPIDLLCERCGRLIGKFALDKVRDFVHANGETCKTCLKREEKLVRMFEGMKVGYVKKLDTLLEKAKVDLAKMVEGLANEPDSDG
jgi:superfamily II helicase